MSNTKRKRVSAAPPLVLTSRITLLAPYSGLWLDYLTRSSALRLSQSQAASDLVCRGLESWTREQLLTSPTSNPDPNKK